MAHHNKPRPPTALAKAKAALWRKAGQAGSRLLLWAKAVKKDFFPALDGLRKAISGLAFVGLTGLLLWVAATMTLDSEYYIAPIGLPEPLKNAGASEFSVSHALRGQLERIRFQAFDGGTKYSAKFNLQIRTQPTSGPSDTADFRPLRHLEDLPDLVVPDSNISLVAIAAYLREVFGLSHARITGDIIEASTGSYAFHGSINGTPIVSEAMPTAPINKQIPELLRQAALLAEREYEPDVAALYLSRADPDAAIEVLRRYVASADGPPRHYAWAFNLWGNILRSEQRYHEAIDKYRLALLLAPAKDPINAAIHGNMGGLFLLVKNFKAAEAEFSSAVAIERNARYLSNLAIAQRHLNRPGDAIKTYEEAIALDPSYAPAYSNLGNLLDDQGRWREAIDKFDAAIAIQPGFADAYLNLGYLYHLHGMLDDALSTYMDAATFESWSNVYTVRNIELVLVDYLAQTPLSVERRERALGIYCRHLQMPDAADASRQTIAARLGHPACTPG